MKSYPILTNDEEEVLPAASSLRFQPLQAEKASAVAVEEKPDVQLLIQKWSRRIGQMSPTSRPRKPEMSVQKRRARSYEYRRTAYRLNDRHERVHGTESRSSKRKL